MAGRPSTGNRKSGRRRRKNKVRMSSKGDGEEGGEEEEEEQLYSMDSMLAEDDTVQLVVKSEVLSILMNHINSNFLLFCFFTTLLILSLRAI